MTETTRLLLNAQSVFAIIAGPWLTFFMGAALAGAGGSARARVATGW